MEDGACEEKNNNDFCGAARCKNVAFASGWQGFWVGAGAGGAGLNVQRESEYCTNAVGFGGGKHGV